MIDGMFQATTLPILEKVVNFSQARHNVLAGNLANMDTPGYQAQDLSPEKFEERLRELIETRHNTAAMGSFAAADLELGDLQGKQRGDDDWGNLLRHDLADVSMEQQIAQLSKNQLQHNLAITIMTSQFRLLQAAISERV